MKISPHQMFAYAFLIVLAIAAILMENGMEQGLWILGAIAYMCSLLWVIMSLLSSIALRKVALDRWDLLFAFFAAAFAAVALTFARNWFPLLYISGIVSVTAVVIWTFAHVVSRRHTQ